MELQQRSLKKLQLLKMKQGSSLCLIFIHHRAIYVFTLLFYICSIFPFLDADCVFRYLVTLHDRFICLHMKLLPKRK